MTGRLVVLDSSAVLAVLFDEPGREAVFRLMQGALLSAVNLAELLARCIERDYSELAALDFIAGAQIRVVEFDYDAALAAAALRRLTGKRVLALGDRACLALAISRNATALTADRIWSQLNVGCTIEVIR